MPPPTKAGALADAQAQLQQNLAVLKGERVLNEATGKPVTRLEAAMKVWTHAMAGESQREDVFKAQLAPNLIALMDRGQPLERWAACGVVHALAQSEKHIGELISQRVITLAAGLLAGGHDRSRLGAAQLLAHLAPRVEYAPRVADTALLHLLTGCRPDGNPPWAAARATSLACATAIRALIENAEGESPSARAARREALIQAGAVPLFVSLVTYTPRMPLPAALPRNAIPPSTSCPGLPGDLQVAPPGAAAGGGGGKTGRGAALDTLPAGRKDQVATQAAACLRCLSLCPSFQQEVLASGALQDLVRCLPTCGVEAAAPLCGTLWELTSVDTVARAVADAGGVAALLHVLTRNVGQAKRKPAPKRKAPVAGGKTGPRKYDTAQKLPSPPEIAVCNAAGALHHLSFLDSVKAQVIEQGGAPLLLACLKLGNPQTYENATGVLWNCGLIPANRAVLAAAGAPTYLSRPVPDAWLVEPDAPEPHTILKPASGTDPAGIGRVQGGPGIFVTQAVSFHAA